MSDLPITLVTMIGVLLIYVFGMLYDYWQARKARRQEITKLTNEINQRAPYKMDTSIQPISGDDIMILTSGRMCYRKAARPDEIYSASTVAVGSMHYAGFQEAMLCEYTSIETSEREAV